MSRQNNFILKQMEIGPMQNFQYFIGDSETKEVAVVDPAWDADYLKKKAAEEGLTIRAALITHGHFDHINGLDDLLSDLDIPVYISQDETVCDLSHVKSVCKTKDGDKIKIGSTEIEFIATPGHTPGCQCFKCHDTLITGDTLFINGCGRCDLPGGDAKVIYESLFNKIGSLPKDTIIYPGHNYGPVPYATLESVRKMNPYFKAKDLDEFLYQRMGY